MQEEDQEAHCAVKEVDFRRLVARFFQIKRVAITVEQNAVLCEPCLRTKSEFAVTPVSVELNLSNAHNQPSALIERESYVLGR